LVVDEIRLPALVGLLGLEADVGAAGSLARLRCDQPGAGKVPGHRGPGHRDAVVLGQVPAQGVRAGVQALVGQLLTQPDYQLDRRRRDRGRRAVRTPRPRFERGLALGAVAGDQLADPALGHPIPGRHYGLRLAGQHRGDHELRFRHTRTLTPNPSCLCPDTPVSDDLRHGFPMS